MLAFVTSFVLLYKTFICSLVVISFADIFSYIPENSISNVIQEMSTWMDHTGDMEDCFHGDKIRCYAYTVTGGLCVRTNTVASYCETNRQACILTVNLV